MIKLSSLIACATLLILVASPQNDGRLQFQARCAGCHGEDGKGDARGFNIVDTPSRARSREALRDVILKGIPDRGMPASAIPDQELDSITTYVIELRSRGTPNSSVDPGVPAAASSAPGDAAAGELFYNG